MAVIEVTRLVDRARAARVAEMTVFPSMRMGVDVYPMAVGDVGHPGRILPICPPYESPRSRAHAIRARGHLGLDEADQRHREPTKSSRRAVTPRSEEKRKLPKARSTAVTRARAQPSSEHQASSG
jgi:hypothetical protein